MKKKRWKALLIVACILATGSGCSRAEDKQVEENVEHTEAIINLGDAKEEKLDLESDSLNYKDGTDAQSFLYAAEVTKAENGYYYWDEMNEYGFGMLMYYDIESEQSVPLCSRPNCNHDSTECNAYFNRAGEAGDYFDRTFIQYYDGDVYILGYDSEYYVNLYKVAADGSSWEKYMRLYKADLTPTDGSDTDSDSDVQTMTWTAPRVMIHRGYVYYVIWNESVPKIRRIKLGGTETEILYETSGERAAIDWMKIYGDYVFFRSVNYTDDNYIDFEGAILAYNIESNKLYTVKKGNIGDFYIGDNTLYYSTDAEVRCYNLVTQEDISIVENVPAYARIMVDSKYLYTYDWDTHTLAAYTLDGNDVAKLVNSEIGNCWFGDEQYFFARGTQSKAILDVKELQEGSGKWKFLN